MIEFFYRQGAGTKGHEMLVRECSECDIELTEDEEGMCPPCASRDAWESEAYDRAGNR